MLLRTTSSSDSDSLGKSSPLVIGKITAHHGLKGWVKVKSYTRPAEHLGEYMSVFLGRDEQSQDWQQFEVSAYRLDGTSGLVKMEEWESREDAQDYIGCLIAIDRCDLPELEEGEYYWADLMGCDVVNKNGIALGQVADIMETGANDVLVVRQGSGHERIGETLVPWIPDTVLDIDQERRRVLVDWHEDD